MSAAAFLSVLAGAAPQRSGVAASVVGQGESASTFSGLLATAETFGMPGPETRLAGSKASKTGPISGQELAATEPEALDPSSAPPAPSVAPVIRAAERPAVGPMDSHTGALTVDPGQPSGAASNLTASSQDQTPSAPVAPGSGAAAMPHRPPSASASGMPTDTGRASSSTLPVQGQRAASAAATSDGSRATVPDLAPNASALASHPFVTSASVAGALKVAIPIGAAGKANAGSGSSSPTASVATPAPTGTGDTPNVAAARSMPPTSATPASREGPGGAAAPAPAQSPGSSAATASVRHGETAPAVSAVIVAPRGGGGGRALADPSGIAETAAPVAPKDGGGVKLSESGAHPTTEPGAHGDRAEARAGSSATPAFGRSSGAAAGADTAGPSTNSPSAGSTSAAPTSSAMNASAAQPSPVFDPGAVETPSEPAPVMHDMAEGVTDTPQLERAVASSASGAHGLSFLSRASVETTALLAARMLNRLDQKVTRFDMALTPEGLGQVEVSMDIEADGQLTARLAFDNPAAAAEMRGRVDELRRQLEQAGFTLGEDALEFSSPDQGGSNASLFGDGRRSGAGHAFRAGDRLALDADQPPPVWMSLKTAPDGVDVKV